MNKFNSIFKVFFFKISNFQSREFQILFVFIFTALNLVGQVSQTAVYELEQKNSDHALIIVSRQENGLALIRDTEKFEGSKKKWEVIFLDSTLKETWNAKLEIEQQMNLLGYDYRNGNIYLIFQEREANGREINLAEILYADRKIEEHKFKPEINLRFTHFSVLKNKAIFGGYLNTEPILLMYDLHLESAKVIPGVFQKKVELMDVRTNSNDTFNVLLFERSAGANRKIVVRTYDSEGIMLVDDIIAVEEGKSIIEAITSSLVHDELIILGSWTYGINKQAAGIFSVMVDPFNNQKVNYYNLTDLDHFLDYLKPTKAVRIKAREQRKISSGKESAFRKYLSVLKIEENQKGFFLLTEIYDSPINFYNPRTNTPFGYYPYNNYYSPYGYTPGLSSMPYQYSSPYRSNPYGSSYSSSGETNINLASLSFFDSKGKLKADHSLKLQDARSNTKEQVSDFVIRKDTCTLAFKNENEISIQTNELDGTILMEEKVKPIPKNQNETIRSEYAQNSGIRAWYGRYFYVYGYHTVKDNINKTSRDVFYINKIKV